MQLNLSTSFDSGITRSLVFKCLYQMSQTRTIHGIEYCLWIRSTPPVYHLCMYIFEAFSLVNMHSQCCDRLLKLCQRATHAVETKFVIRQIEDWVHPSAKVVLLGESAHPQIVSDTIVQIL